jgi:hypothetical protein
MKAQNEDVLVIVKRDSEEDKGCSSKVRELKPV